jgi:hypothetical protein
VDLSYLEQLAESGQTEAIARIIGTFATGKDSREVRKIARSALSAIREESLGSLGDFRGHPGELSLPRMQEIAAAINRVRSLEASTENGHDPPTRPLPYLDHEPWNPGEQDE